MNVIEVPFEKLTIEFLRELHQNGMEGTIDGDKQSLQLTSVYVVSVLQTNSETSFRSPN
jgi:hypothetical protein